jgi:hypothetical protein
VHRDFHTATAIGQLMIIFGGRSDLTGGQWQPPVNMGPDYYSNKVSYFDAATSTWQREDTMGEEGFVNSPLFNDVVVQPYQGAQG